jgi:hypothetical protein
MLIFMARLKTCGSVQVQMETEEPNQYNPRIRRWPSAGADDVNVRQGLMRHAYIDHPGFSFASSIGAIALQVASFFSLCWLVTVLPGVPKFIWASAYVMWYLIPLVSVVGIWSAVKRLRNKKGIFLSVLGLSLNVCYLGFFFLITVSAATSDNAWNF